MHRATDLLLAGLVMMWSWTAWIAPAVADAGEAIYRDGRLSDGAPLTARREGVGSIEGVGAACATCHRRSGLGGSEGRFPVPPIIGRYLFRSLEVNVADADLPHVMTAPTRREAYTPETFAAALQEGIDPSGRPLSYLMPRYRLAPAEIAALTDYLRRLTSEPVPGVSADTLHFATIITPDADPVQRAGMLDVMQKFFEDKNAFQRGGTRRMQAVRQVDYRVTRRWQLHVWELTGAPSTWRSQLTTLLRKEPVFAVIGGLGKRDWEPVHRFCEQEGLPCLFPNIDVPVVAEDDVYTLYFSRGVALEADLMRDYLLSLAAGRTQRNSAHVLQVMREGDIGVEAAAQFARTAAAAGLVVRNYRLPAGSGRPGDVAAAMAAARPDEALVLWLRGPDVAALEGTPPPLAPTLVSAAMAGWENAPLPDTWRQQVRMPYTVDLPAQRQARMNYARSWFKIRQIAVTDEHLQTNTYIACGILAETLNEMLDAFVRDYLIERVEAMLPHRVVNGFYRTLGLGPHQRFASKGGYIVRFGADARDPVVAEGDWQVPEVTVARPMPAGSR